MLPLHSFASQVSSLASSGQAAPPCFASWATPLDLVLLVLAPVLVQIILHLTNLQLCSRLTLHIGQCCKALVSPKPDRQLLQSLPFEQLPFLSSWFHLRRLRCSRTMMTNLQLCSQLVENIVNAENIVMVARIMMMEKAVMMKMVIIVT